MAQYHILVVTSDPELGQKLASAILRPAAYEVTLAKGVMAAETAFRSFPPDLVILDPRIEDGGGLDFAQNLIQHMPIIPVVLIGEGEKTRALELALELGAADALMIPLNPSRVVESVERCINRRRHLENWTRRRSQESTDALRRRLGVLETLQQVGRKVTASLDLDEVLKAVIEAAVNMTGAEEGSLLLLNEESGELYMRAAFNFHDEFVKTFRLPVQDSLAGQVVRTGQATIIDQDTPQKIKTAYLVRSLMYVPLKIQERVIGVLGVDNRTSSQPFLEQHLTLVSALGDYAAIAIENARLYRDTEIARNKVEAIIRNIADGVIVLDEDQRVVLINRAAAAAFEVPTDDVTNQPLAQVIQHEPLLEIFRDAGLTYPYRCELTLEDGRVLNAQLSWIQDVGQAVTMQDITYLKELDRIKTDFVNTVSHDLRSPLTAILGYVELIARVGEVNAQQRDFIERVQISVRNITNLINDLLELGRIESGFDARKEFVPLPAVIEYSIESLESNIVEKEHKITINTDGEFDKVFGDPTRLRQLVDNLIGNAVRYTPKGGEVSVDLQSETDQVILRVSDTGPGIPPADQPYIFDRFYRASNIDTDIPGSGLGLAIVKTIVENHQGRVWVDSTLGEGSTFTVVLPVADDAI